MDQEDCKQTGVSFVFLMLLTSGGFREALTQLTLPLKNNVTQFLGPNIVIVCSSDSMSSTSNQQPSWYKYDPQKKLIYDSTSPGDTDTSKYSVGNGNNTLTVMNVQLSDALTYCCNIGGLRDYCSNVVLIESLTASVNPSNGVEVGEAVSLTCFLSYNAPSKDDNSPFPLSDDQDPNLSMLIGQDEITKDMTEQIVGTDTVPNSKTLSFNRTVAKEDAGKNLTCKISSANPRLESYTSTVINVNVATKTAEIRYPNGTRSPDDVYPLNSVFTCVGDGFPPPTVEWLDGNKKLIGGRGQGSVTWSAKQQGTYDLICSARNTLSQNTTYNATRVKVGDAEGNTNKTETWFVGLLIVLPTVLTAGCIVVIVGFAIGFAKAYKRGKVSPTELQTATISTTQDVNTWSTSQMENGEHSPALYNSLITAEPSVYETIARTPDADGIQSTVTETWSASHMENAEENSPSLYSSLINAEPSIYEAIVRTPNADGIQSTVSETLATHSM